MIPINEFAASLQEYLEHSNSDISKTNYKQVEKNNGTTLHGIIVRTEASNVAPVIYIDDLYAKYQNGQHTLASACDQFGMMYKEAKVPIRNLCISLFTDIENAKENLSIEMINMKANSNLLKNVPYIEYGDLAGIYKVHMGSIGEGIGTITVTNDHVAGWGITNEELHKRAMANLEKSEYSIKSMKDVFMEEIGGDDLLGEIDKSQNTMPLYVLSNRNKLHGASGILRTDLLQSFAEKMGSNLVVLPSSIHEVLLIPDQKVDINIQDFIDMVTEINTNDVAVEERLSNNAYFYDKEKSELQQGVQKTPMHAKIHSEQENRRASVLGRLKTNKDKLQGPENSPIQGKEIRQEKGR